MKRNMHRVIYKSNKKQCGTKNEDMKPEDIFNKLLSTINKVIENPDPIRKRHHTEFIDKCDAIHFKQICESLNPTDDIHNQIKSIITKKYIKKKENIHSTYTSTLRTLNTKSITDLTINFPNGETFKCLKMIIQKIPYFDMMIKDCDDTTPIILTDNYNDFMVLMELLYQSVHFTGITENVVDVLLLSDKYLMTDDLNPLMFFFKENVNAIIKYLIDNNEFDKILSVYKYFNDMTYDETYGTPRDIVKSLYNINFGEFMFNIDNWNLKFNEDVIIRVITQTARYDLLNIINVSPLKILKLLSHIDIKNNTYDRLGRYSHTHQSALIHAPSHLTTVYDDAIVIASYYPNFEYTIYEKVKCRFSAIDDNSNAINFSFTQYCPEPLTIGTKFVINDNINTDNHHTLTKILKIKGDKIVDVQDADDFAGFGSCKFILHFDKPVRLKTYTCIWSVENGGHVIDI